jgi:5-methylcytosine-specific restriction endonuclease McrA
MRINRKDVNWKDHQFGQLTIISSYYKPAKSGSKGYFKCKCSCGNETTQRMDAVISSRVISCGCYRTHLSRTRFGYKPDEAIKYDMIKRYKAGASLREFQWLLSDEKTLLLFDQNCHYCGKKPSTLHAKGSHFQGSFVYNGIDRVNNEPYYTDENTVTCCKSCNSAKLKMTAVDFVNHVEKMYSFVANPHKNIKTSELLETKSVIIRRLFNNEYGRRARRNKVPFELELEKFIFLTQQDCHYCGLPPSNEIRRGKHKYTYSSLDRLVGSCGYVDTNVVPCCHRCNLMKNARNYVEFREWIDDVHQTTSKHIKNPDK